MKAVKEDNLDASLIIMVVTGDSERIEAVAAGGGWEAGEAREGEGEVWGECGGKGQRALRREAKSSWEMK